jgi:hypothetical protein
MNSIQPGVALKLRRLEQGKQSSLCDLRGAYLADRVLNAPEAELKAEKPEAICLILKKLAGYSALLNSTQIERIVSVMVEVVQEKGENAVKAFDFFITKAPKPASLSRELNHKVNELFLQKNFLYLSLVVFGPGNNLGSLYVAMCTKNEARVLELLKKVDFSFVQPRVPTLLVEGYMSLSKETFKKLLLKLDPSHVVIKNLIIEKEVEAGYFGLANVMIEGGLVKKPQIQELYDFSVRVSSAPWMAFFATRGAVNPSQGAPYPIPLFEPIPDSNVARYIRTTKMMEDFPTLDADESRLKQITHNSLKVYKKDNPPLYYFLLAKRVSLTWGFRFDIKNPFSEKNYDPGFTEGLSRLIWVDSLKTFPARAQHPFLDHIIKIIYNTKNLNFHGKYVLSHALQDINKGNPVLIDSGYDGHFAAEFFHKDSYAYCDRSSSTPGVLHYLRDTSQKISKATFDRLIAEKDLPLEKKMDMDERIDQLKLDSEVHLEMKVQAAENCTIASFDAVLLHLLSEFSTFRDESEIRQFYKSLTQHLRRETLYILFDEVLTYLKTQTDREVSQLLYTLLAGVFIKLSNSPSKLGSEEEGKHLINMTFYLMKRLEG